MGDIVLDGLTKAFGEAVAVDAIDLAIEDGELLALVGPSGCGKTTLLRLIAGLERPTGGSISIGGSDLTDRPPRERNIGFVFQDYALFPHLNVRQNLSFNLRMRGGPGTVDSRVETVAALLGIDDLLDRDIEALSGGQKQRVALGRAIGGEPTAFLLDEPLANLDATLREQMQTEIVRLHRRLGTTTVHVTHNQREALAIGDRVAVMHEGSIEQVDPPEAVYHTPANLFVARFVGSPTMNTLRGEYDPGRGAVTVEHRGGAVEIPIDGLGNRPREVVVGSRPEHTDIVSGAGRGPGWLETTVDVVEFHGADRFVYLQPVQDAGLVARAGPGASFERGAPVSVRFASERLHVFDAGSTARIALQNDAVSPADGPVGHTSTEDR